MVILVMFEHVGTVNTRIDHLQLEKKNKWRGKNMSVERKRNEYRIVLGIVVSSAIRLFCKLFRGSCIIFIIVTN